MLILRQKREKIADLEKNRHINRVVKEQTYKQSSKKNRHINRVVKRTDA